MKQASPNETTIYYNDHQQPFGDTHGESSDKVSFVQWGIHQLGVNWADLRGSVNFSSLPEWCETAKVSYEVRENESRATAPFEEVSPHDRR